MENILLWGITRHRDFGFEIEGGGGRFAQLEVSRLAHLRVSKEAPAR